MKTNETLRATDVPAPGYFIREEMEARGWIQSDLAFVLGVPEQAVNLIISGKRGISPDMAKALGDAFDVHPDFFANLQTAYEMSRAREPEPGVAKRARVQSVYPVREMMKRGWLEDISMLEPQLARFFEVDSVEDIPHLPHAAKKTSYDEVSPIQLAWLFRARQMARAIASPKYAERKMREALPLLRALTVDPEEIRNVPRIMAEVGVRLVIVEALPGGKIDGACFWLDGTPVVALSLRLDRIDNFWFVLRHEIEHVLQRHGERGEILDIDMDNLPTEVSAEEKIANDAAAAFCIDPAVMDDFIFRKDPFFSEKDVLGFAKTVQAHPGIVVGQIQRYTQRWELLRRHQVKIRQHIIPTAFVDGWGQVAPISL